MEAILYLVLVGLLIWWLAQTILCVCGYFQKRREVRKISPPTDEEKRALARVRADTPEKEKQPIGWYIRNPRYALKQGWIFIPILVFFWPMAILFLTLPAIEERLSRDLVRRVNSER